MATGGLYGYSTTGALVAAPGAESSGLYGSNNNFSTTYFEWFIFQESATAPATPTGGSWNFVTNVGTAPTGWSSTPPVSPVNTVWASISIVNSRSTAALTWTAPASWVKPGIAATIAVGTTTTGAPGTSASVNNSGTSNAAIFNFQIPRGDVGATGAAGATGSAATIAAGTTTTLSAGSSATVANSGSTSAAVFNFGIPQGAKGDAGTAATITAGTTSTLSAGSSATVTNSGTSSAAIFNFGIPQGAAATITAGTTTTLSPGASATVTNTGTSSAAIFNFEIPQGTTGSQGIPGINWVGTWSSSTSYAVRDAVTYNGTSYYAIVANTNQAPPNTTYWNVLAQKGADGNGAVSSVALAAPSLFTVSGSPVTSSGTLTLSYSGTALPVLNGGTGVTTSSGANSVVLRDANANITTNCLFEGYFSQAASGTTIVLTASSVQNWQITGSGGQIIKLPNATSLPNGATFTFNNNQSSGAITVQNNSSTTVATINSGGYVTIVLLDNSIAAGSWDRHDSTPSNVSWSTNTLDYPGSITSATWNGVAIAINRGGTGASTAAAALTNLGAYPASNPNGYTNNTGTVTSVSGTGTVSGISLSGTVTSSGSLTLGGTLDLSSPPAIGSTAANTGAFTYASFPSQSVAPTTPSTGFTQYASSTGMFSWKGTNGFIRQFDASGITADRTWVLPNTAGTIALTSNLGTIASQNANSVAITGGSIDSTTVGATTASTGAFTTLSASSTVSGAGFSTYLASPPAIGGTAASTGQFTTVTSTVATGTAPFTVASTTAVANLSIGGNAGTVTNGVYTTDTGTVTNTMLAGSITNAKLVNSSITFGSTAQALGSTVSGISGVTIDNGIIGGTTAAAGTFTTLTGTTSTTTPIVQNSAAAAIAFKTNSATSAVTQFNISHTASAVNYVQVTGAGAGNPPVISSQGATTPDLDLTLTPKGAGRVNITTSIKPKVNSAASVTSPLAWNSTSYDEYALTALANALTINADANTAPADGQKMMFRFKDNGTARALTWTTGATNAFRVVGVTLPTTTVASKLLYVGCIYNAADSRWDAIAVGQEV